MKKMQFKSSQNMQKNSVLIQDIGQKSDTESYNGEGQRAK